MFKICAHQFRQAFFSPRLYLALILGCTIQIISVFPLLDFSKAMGEPLGIFEAFIYFNTDTYTATCAFLGAVLMVSDIPFLARTKHTPFCEYPARPGSPEKFFTCLVLAKCIILCYLLLAHCLFQKMPLLLIYGVCLLLFLYRIRRLNWLGNTRFPSHTGIC